jgi:monoamine oxidase
MKSVKIESSIKIIMKFSIRFWGKEKKIVCVHKQTNDYVFFVDAS